MTENRVHRQLLLILTRACVRQLALPSRARSRDRVRSRRGITRPMKTPCSRHRDASSRQNASRTRWAKTRFRVLTVVEGVGADGGGGVSFDFRRGEGEARLSSRDREDRRGARTAGDARVGGTEGATGESTGARGGLRLRLGAMGGVPSEK